MTSIAESITVAPAHLARQRLAADPLGPVLALGEREVRVGFVLGIVGALLLHAALGAQAATTLGEVHAFAVLVRSEVRDRLNAQIDVDLSEPPPPPPRAAEPEPEPAPTAAPPPPTHAPPPSVAPPPPAAAEAGKVLTQAPDPNEPVDLTGEGFVSGSGDRYAGGVTASTGTSKNAVNDVRAEPAGVGKASPSPVAPSGPDLSKPAAPMGGSWNDCEFPAEADIEGIDAAVVQLSVIVGPNGRAKSVAILRDPGNGFGQSARNCAFRKQFNAALDRGGNPITMSTAPFTVRFTR